MEEGMSSTLVIVEDADGTSRYFSPDQIDVVVVRLGVDTDRANGFLSVSDVYEILGRKDHPQAAEVDVVEVEDIPPALDAIIETHLAVDEDPADLALDFGRGEP
jgi:hypothetical protein